MSLVRCSLAAAAALVGPTAAHAQAPSRADASATATASASIVDPIGILAVTAGSNPAAAASRSAGMAQLSGGSFAIQGPANEVMSVSVTLPANVQRVGGGGALPVAVPRQTTSRILTAEGTTAFTVMGGAPVQDAPGGLYAGLAEVLVNLN